MRWEGECVNGVAQGWGVQTDPDGARIEGVCVHGVMQGLSVETSPDGTRYEGEYVDGKLHGRWLVTRADGTRLERHWVNGTMVSEKVSRPDPHRVDLAPPAAHAAAAASIAQSASKHVKLALASPCQCCVEVSLARRAGEGGVCAAGSPPRPAPRSARLPPAHRRS
jgi:hypothetical protein